MSRAPSPSAASASRPTTRWWALALIAAAQFMVIMDTSIIGVALPEMRRDLGFAPEDLSWVFNAYVIAFGGLLLLGGRLSDLLGARRVFIAGWVTLLVGSALAGVAGNIATELTGRVLQGAGSALIAPSALTLLMVLFASEPKELTKALALYGAAAPAGGTAGVFLGGVLTEWASWPWVFYVNIPVALVIAFGATRVMPDVPGSHGSHDWVGGLTVTSGLAALVYAIVRAPELGWTGTPTLGVAGAAVLLLGAFLVVQATHRHPLVRLGIFRTPALGAANAAQFLLGAAWVPMWFFLNLYLQQVLGYSAFPSGAALLPMTLLIMASMVLVAPRVIARFGPKRPLVAGMAALAAGLAWMAFVRPDGSYLADVLGASLIAAAGMSLAFIPSLGIALSSAKPEEGGLAAGLVNSSYQVGSALGLAAMTAVAAANGADQVGNLSELTDGYSAAFIGAALIAAAGALAVAVTLRLPKPAAGTTEQPREKVAA